ncbi:MAG: hypothetical protein JWM80_1992 [Cyanobacteria bacterium RYN_339]|nr:hypothetical protein [Cyanobacteria bacterium RYN_339]
MSDNEFSRMTLLQVLFTMFQPTVEDDENPQAQLERLYNRF